MSLVVGIDSSTQSCKIEVRDADSGELVHSASAPHPPTVPPRSEQAPDAWWHALSSLLDDHTNDAAAISVAGQQHGMVALDEQRRVLRPAKLWNDTESAPQAHRLVEELGAAYWAEHTGSVPVASFTVTKLAWLREHEPEVFARVRHVLLPHDWLTYRLTGELVTDRGDASGTGYWSPATGEYSAEILERVGLDPRVTPTVLGPSTSPGAWGDAVVGPGTGDNMAAALGLGLVEGDVAISLGTSGTVFAVSDHPTADTTGAVAGFADASGRYLPLVCTLNATKVTDTMARLLGCDRRELEQLALECRPGAGGVLLLPYLDGERTPDLPDATGTLAGLRSDTEPAQLARAAYEGVVCGLLDALDALGRAGVPVGDGRIVVVGGGARSALYPQLIADFTQRPVEVPEPAEYVARGACVQAAAALISGDVTTVAREWAPRDGRTIDADPTVDAAGVRAQYRDLLQRTHPEPGDRP